MAAPPPPMAAPMSAPFLPPASAPMPAPAPADPPMISARFCHVRARARSTWAGAAARGDRTTGLGRTAVSIVRGAYTAGTSPAGGCADGL
jgi:hypothetical protein